MDSQKTSRDEIRGHLVESIAPPQQNLINKTVKKCGHKSMTPDPITVTARTHIRSEARIIPPLKNNLLDGNGHKDYHQ
jgi:hypothetical protein